MVRKATPSAYAGRWRRLKNDAADERGSIHDDDAARAIGFEAAFVPGSIVGTAALPAVFDRYGPGWMEGGWYDFKFISPVYEHNEVRERAEAAVGTEDISVRVETRDERLCCIGRAGLGKELPWDAESDGSRGADEVLPDIEIGLPYDETEFTVTPDSAASMLDAAGEDSPWYRDASPWGGPVVPPEWLMSVALQQRLSRKASYDGVRNPGMWSAHWLSLRKPLMLDTPYRMEERVVDKGRSQRTIFLTSEFTVRDADGAEMAVGRHQSKWFPE